MYAGDEQNAMPITELHFCTTVCYITTKFIRPMESVRLLGGPNRLRFDRIMATSLVCSSFFAHPSRLT